MVRKAYIIEFGNGCGTMVTITDKMPTRADLVIQLEYQLEQELYEIEHGYSGFRTYANIKKEIKKVKEDNLKKKREIAKHNFNIKFISLVKD